MKLVDIIEQIDKSPELAEQVYISEIAEKQFDLYINYWDKQTRLVFYYLASWHCTDSQVGYRAYFFDDKLVAVSEQHGRKGSEKFKWVSKELYDEVKIFIKTFDNNEEINYTPTLLDLEEDWNDYFKIVFYEQMYDFHKNNATYKGDTVEIIDVIKSHHENGKFIPEHCEIKYSNGLAHIVVPTDSLDFKYNLTKNMVKNLFKSK